MSHSVVIAEHEKEYILERLEEKTGPRRNLRFIIEGINSNSQEIEGVYGMLWDTVRDRS